MQFSLIFPSAFSGPLFIMRAQVLFAAKENMHLFFFLSGKQADEVESSLLLKLLLKF